MVETRWLPSIWETTRWEKDWPRRSKEAVNIMIFTTNGFCLQEACIQQHALLTSITTCACLVTLSFLFLFCSYFLHFYSSHIPSMHFSPGILICIICTTSCLHLIGLLASNIRYPLVFAHYYLFLASYILHILTKCFCILSQNHLAF